MQAWRAGTILAGDSHEVEGTRMNGRKILQKYNIDQ